MHKPVYVRYCMVVMVTFGQQDKFGYNVVSGADNYLDPGSNSFRSHQLEGL